jgi:hypothetical protein
MEVCSFDGIAGMARNTEKHVVVVVVFEKIQMGVLRNLSANRIRPWMRQWSSIQTDLFLDAKRVVSPLLSSVNKRLFQYLFATPKVKVLGQQSSSTNYNYEQQTFASWSTFSNGLRMKDCRSKNFPGKNAKYYSELKKDWGYSFEMVPTKFYVQYSDDPRYPQHLQLARRWPSEVDTIRDSTHKNGLFLWDPHSTTLEKSRSREFRCKTNTRLSMTPTLLCIMRKWPSPYFLLLMIIQHHV